MAVDYSVNTKGPAFESTQEFLITYILTFACAILFVIPFKVHFVHILWRLHQLYIFTGIFVQPLHIGYIIIGLYRASHETGQARQTLVIQTPYLHPHLPNDLTGKKLQYHQQGKKL